MASEMSWRVKYGLFLDTFSVQSQHWASPDCETIGEENHKSKLLLRLFVRGLGLFSSSKKNVVLLTISVLKKISVKPIGEVTTCVSLHL